MHLLNRIGCAWYYFDTMPLKILTRMHSSLLIIYTCRHTCVRNILFHDHAYRIDRGDNVAGIQRRRGRGSAGDSSSHSSRRRGADSRRAPWVPRSLPHLFPQRQAPEHFKSPMFYEILLESFMFDALGYKSWLKTLDAWNYLIQIYTPLTLCRSRIEYMLSPA